MFKYGIPLFLCIGLSIFFSFKKYDSTQYISKANDATVVDNNRYIFLDKSFVHVYDVKQHNQICYVRTLSSQLCYVK